MNWYSKYLEIFETAPTTVSENTKKEIRYKLSGFQNRQPIVSVVMIAHNEEQHLWASLWSLSDNDCSLPVEIIGVDNCSTDSTSDIFSQSGIRWFKESRKGPGYARQCGLEHARGAYHLCADADTLYPPHYIQNMIQALMKPNVATVYGLWSFIPGDSHPKIGLLAYEFLRDLHLRLLSYKRPELCVRGMSFGFRSGDARQIGFRTDIRRGEDGSMALQLKRFGKLEMLTDRKTRVRTGSVTLNSGGSLIDNLIARIKHAGRYFTKKEAYKDELKNRI